jgi:hypothetical protein
MGLPCSWVAKPTITPGIAPGNMVWALDVPAIADIRVMGTVAFPL